MHNLFEVTQKKVRPVAFALAASACVFGATSLTPSSASAAVFEYNLSDHPDGGLANPTYGLRLDGLYGGDSNDFTFSFNQPGTGMTLLYDNQANSVRIVGRAFGGIDTGSSYDANNGGFVDIDFTYKQNIVTTGTGTIGTDTSNVGVRTTGDAQTVGTGNSGTITLATGVGKSLGNRRNAAHPRVFQRLAVYRHLRSADHEHRGSGTRRPDHPRIRHCRAGPSPPAQAEDRLTSSKSKYIKPGHCPGFFVPPSPKIKPLDILVSLPFSTNDVIVYDGRGVTTRVSRLTTTAMTVYADIIAPAAGEKVTVFIEGVGKIDSCVTAVEPPRIDLSLLTDTQARWRRIQTLRHELS